MRFTVRRMLAVLVVMFALGAVAVASASAAEPEFTVESNFKATFGEPSWGGSIGEWMYRKATITGEASSKKTFKNITVTMTEGNNGCNTNTKTNELKLTGLKARLGIINQANKEVGLMFEPTKQPFGECTQRGIAEKLLGVFIGSIADVGSSKTQFALDFKRKGVTQEPQYFEGEKETEKIFPFMLGEGGCEVHKHIIGGKEYETETCSHKGSETAVQGEGALTFERGTELINP